MVYFIVDYENNACKIGYSERPKTRLKSIQSTYPFKLSLAKVIPGDRSIEESLHMKYNDHKIKGEWFDLNAIEELSEGIGYEKTTVEIVKHVFTTVDKQSGYYNLTEFLYNYSGISGRSLHPSVYLKRDTYKLTIELLKERGVKEPVIKQRSTWVHPMVFYDIIKDLDAKLKSVAYDFMLQNIDIKGLYDHIRGLNK